MKLKWNLIAALLLLAIVLTGCAATDDVNDPLANYGVDAVVPFPTKKPGASTPTPSPAPSPSPTDVVTSVTQGWQTELLPTPSQSTSTSEYKQLARGNSGEAVRALQARLKELGYLTGSVDGSYGSQTETAVKRFQKAIGLTQTGVASTYLQERLFASNAPAYQATAVSATATPAPTKQPVSNATANPYKELSYGATGTNVLMLQNRLRALGYLTGSADGIFGAQTRQAIMRFEEAYGKPQTGVATEALLKVLYSDSARPYSEAFPTVTPSPTPYHYSGSNGSYTLLSYGSKGDDVKRLQARLVELGYLQSTVTGNYYNKTVEAVSKFQKAVNLSETGVATAAMQEILFSSSAPRYSASAGTPAPSSGYTQLSYGSIGQPVAEMQARLIELGFLSGSADGYYYAQTVEAVKAFQAALNWSQTGVATSDMLAVLFSSAAPNNGVNSASPYTELSVGANGTAVYALQARLVELGYASGTPSGSFGNATAEVVKRFQAALGWDQTGIATIALQERLYASNAPTYTQKPAVTPVPTQKPVLTPTQVPDTAIPSTAYRTLQSGYSGADVAALQNRLVELGYANGTPNGSYGDSTTEAVVRFQLALGMYLPEGMGIATASLQEIMYSPYAPYYVENNDREIELFTYEALEYGTSGEAVYKLKLRLTELGYLTTFLPGYEDIFDEHTLFAVTNIQYVMGVVETDGIATPELQAFLYSEYANNLKIAQ